MAQPSKDIRPKWELIKLAIRNYTLKYAARKQKSDNAKLAILERKLKESEAMLHQVSIFCDIYNHIMGLRSEINQIMSKKTKMQ